MGCHLRPPHWEVLTRLFDGLRIGRAHSALIVDLAPYDGSLQRVLVDLASDNSNTIPDMRCASICWAGLTNEERTRISAFLHRDIRTHIYNLSEQQKYQVPGLATLPSAAEELAKPTYKEQDYLLTHPEANESLPLRQTLFDEWADNSEYRISFNNLVQDHNVQFIRLAGCSRPASALQPTTSRRPWRAGQWCCRCRSCRRSP